MADETNPQGAENANTTEQVADTSPQMSEDDIGALLAFDPFAKGDSEEKPAAQAAPEGGQQQVGETPPAEPEPGKEPDKPGEEASEIALLKKTIEEMRAAAAKPPEQLSQEQKQPQAEGPQIPDYNYVIPDQLMAGLASEDPGERKQAIGALAQGVSQTVHQQVLSQVAQVFNATVPRMIMETISSQKVSQDVKQDFYGTHPDLDDPKLYGFIQQQGMLLMQETGQYQWSPQFRDTLAARVKALLGRSGASAQPQQVVQTAQQPAMFTPGARPAQTSGGAEGDIMSTLFG